MEKAFIRTNIVFFCLFFLLCILGSNHRNHIPTICKPGQDQLLLFLPDVSIPDAEKTSISFKALLKTLGSFKRYLCCASSRGGVGQRTNLQTFMPTMKWPLMQTTVFISTNGTRNQCLSWVISSEWEKQGKNTNIGNLCQQGMQQHGTRSLVEGTAEPGRDWDPRLCLSGSTDKSKIRQNSGWTAPSCVFVLCVSTSCHKIWSSNRLHFCYLSTFS